MVRVRIFIYTSLLFLFALVFNIHIYAMEEIVEDYSYTGNYQEFTAPYTGEYKLEVWGAGGGGQRHSGGYIPLLADGQEQRAGVPAQYV